MDRRAVGETAGGAFEKLKMNLLMLVTELLMWSGVRNCLPKMAFPGYPSAV